MAKEVVKKIKLQIPAGKANPAPPVGTVLGPAGINMQEFCTKYNDATKDKMGDIIPVEIFIYDDRSFDFVLKTPPAAELIKKYAKIKSGSKKGAHEIVATITEADVRAMAEIKMADSNAYDIEAEMRSIEGTARNMGVAVKGVNDSEMAEASAQAEEAEKDAEIETAQEEVVENAESPVEEVAEATEETAETETEDKE